MIDLQMSLPLDADGFIRRKCPNCEQEFKWHWGPTEDHPEDYTEAEVYWCPLCGESAAKNRWWTTVQVEYQRELAMQAVQSELGDELKKVFRNQRGSAIRFTYTPGDKLPTPDPLVEPDDMMMVAPPCHPWEPIKVPDDAAGSFHCLLCGADFAV